METSEVYSGKQGSSSGRKRSREIESRKHPSDLFHSFLTTDPIATQNGAEKSEREEDGEMELNLGLSLGGRFGVDKSHKGLIRASSIAGSVPTFREVEQSVVPEKVAALARTSSLPAETEEEGRRKKEMQSLRRMEARRRRSEKQKESGINSKQSGNAAAAAPALRVKGKGAFFGSLQGLLTQQQQQGNSQGSGESQGGCSSGVSELDTKTHHQGANNCGETRSPASTHSTQERALNKQPETSNHKKKEAESVAGGIEDMPCVFTIGDGPKGRKVEGILYRYCKGEQVRIMCVCHGSFFSPAEFVKHAGGRDVENPLKHIVVNPSPLAF